MWINLLWIALAACQKHAPAPGHDTPPNAVGETADTAHVFTDMEKVPVGPAITIVGQTAAELGGEEPEYLGLVLALGGDLWGDGHETLVTAGWWKSIFFRSLGDPGEIRSTDYDAAIIGSVADTQRRAGDVNQDGFADTWKGHRLFLGPIVGEVDYETDWYARIDTEGATGPNVEGGFDADGDGWTDAVTFSYEMQAVVHYGPFLAGEVRKDWYADKVDRSQLTDVQASCSAQVYKQPWLRPDFFGPGRPAVALGNSRFVGYYCASVIQIHDISGPRGRRLTDVPGDDVLWDQWSEFWPAGDVDGDGAQDLIGADAIVLAPDPAKGKITAQIADVSFEPVANPIRTTGDMDGDGRPEILVRLDNRFVPTGLHSSEYWLVPSGAFRVGEPIDIVQTSVPLKSQDVPHAGHWVDFTSDPWVSGDLDGDGKAELAVGDNNVVEGGRIFIWRGVDLFP